MSDVPPRCCYACLCSALVVTAWLASGASPTSGTLRGRGGRPWLRGQDDMGKSSRSLLFGFPRWCLASYSTRPRPLDPRGRAVALSALPPSPTQLTDSSYFFFSLHIGPTDATGQATRSRTATYTFHGLTPSHDPSSYLSTSNNGKRRALGEFQ